MELELYMVSLYNVDVQKELCLLCAFLLAYIQSRCKFDEL